MFGVMDGILELVEFAYALETIPGTTNAEVDQRVDNLEQEIAEFVVSRLFACSNNHNDGQDTTLVRPFVLMGLSPKPDDVRLTDRACDKDTGANRCDLIRASLAVVYTDEGGIDPYGTVVQQVAEHIRGGMSGGNLNEGPIVRVEWVELSDLV